MNNVGTVTMVVTLRNGNRVTYYMQPFEAALIVLRPPDDVASLYAIGGCDDYLRSHVPYTPYTERAEAQRGREAAHAN